MLVTLGDLVEDVVVRLDEPVNVASDTPARISRRRGGSAANVAAAAAADHPARFVGQVGDDAIGTALVAELAAAGVDVAHVRRRGTTGTIVALVDASGERSMLTDRRACTELTDPDPAWLDGASILHVPVYSLARGAIAATAMTVVDWAHQREIPVSIDLSSSAVLRDIGLDRFDDLLGRLAVDVVLGNLDEADTLGITGAVHGAVTVVKRGRNPATVHRPGAAPVDVAPARAFDGIDTTGAGDAFAAGFVTGPWRDDPVAAVAAGHASAARLLSARVAPRAT